MLWKILFSWLMLIWLVYSLNLECQQIKNYPRLFACISTIKNKKILRAFNCQGLMLGNPCCTAETSVGMSESETRPLKAGNWICSDIPFKANHNSPLLYLWKDNLLHSSSLVYELAQWSSQSSPQGEEGKTKQTKNLYWARRVADYATPNMPLSYTGYFEL